MAVIKEHRRMISRLLLDNANCDVACYAIQELIRQHPGTTLIEVAVIWTEPGNDAKDKE